MIFDQSAKDQLLAMVQALDPSTDTAPLLARIAELEVELSKYIARDAELRARVADLSAFVSAPV